MSARDGTILSDNPSEWDVERIARLDWGYIRQCLIKAAIQQLENPEPAYTRATECFQKSVKAIVEIDEVRRGRHEIEELRELERSIKEQLRELQRAARSGNVGTPTDPSGAAPPS